MTTNISPSLLKCTYWVCVSARVCVSGCGGHPGCHSSGVTYFVSEIGSLACLEFTK